MAVSINTHRGTRSDVKAAHAHRPSVSVVGRIGASVGLASRDEHVVASHPEVAELSIYPKISKALRVVVDAVLVALACVAVLLAAGSIYMISTNGASGIFGYSVEVVASGSMAPTIATGDLIVVKEQSSYKVGDIVTFRDSSGNLVTHRIIAEGNDGTFTTKGDANNVADRSSVNASDIVGSLVFVVPGGEVLVSFAKQPAVIGALVFILVLLIFFPAINKVRTKG